MRLIHSSFMVLLSHQLELMVFIPTPTTMTDHLKNSVTSNLSLPYPLSSYCIGPKNSQSEAHPILLLCTHIHLPGCPRKYHTITWVNAMTDLKIIILATHSNPFCPHLENFILIPLVSFLKLYHLFNYLSHQMIWSPTSQRQYRWMRVIRLELFPCHSLRKESRPLSLLVGSSSFSGWSSHIPAQNQPQSQDSLFSPFRILFWDLPTWVISSSPMSSATPSQLILSFNL